MSDSKVTSLKVATAWTTPEEVAKFLEGIKADSEKHGFRSITIVAELRDGDILDGGTRVEDRFKVGAALMRMAMVLLGFEQRPGLSVKP